MGGEELLVLLPGATAEQAATVMTRFACTLAETVIDIGAHTLRVTATAGVVLAAMPAVSDLSADAVAQIPCVRR